MRIAIASIMLVLASSPMVGGSMLRRNSALVPDELAPLSERAHAAGQIQVHQRLFDMDSVAKRNIDRKRQRGGDIDDERIEISVAIRQAQEIETLEENTEEALETRHDDPPEEHDVAGDSILLRSSESVFVSQVFEGSTATTRQHRDTRPEVRG